MLSAPQMPPHQHHVDCLLERCRALWAGEAWVFAAYWDSPRRTRRSDLVWIARQCHKELVDGALVRAAWLSAALTSTDPVPVHNACDRPSELIGELADEYRHLRAFATAYERLRGEGDPPLTFHDLRTRWRWPANDALVRLRARHRATHGVLGTYAMLFTEGGGATLYRSGAARRGHGFADDVIAEACAAVLADEEAHMRLGMEQILDARLSPQESDALAKVVVAQLRQRIRMRNAQFGHPLSDADLARALAGRAPRPDGDLVPPDA